MFEDNLNNILQGIYVLVHKYGFQASYIESLPPVERDIYLIYAEKEQEQAEKASKPKDMMFGQPIDPLANNQS